MDFFIFRKIILPLQALIIGCWIDGTAVMVFPDKY